jgi:hypothetical protein
VNVTCEGRKEKSPDGGTNRGGLKSFRELISGALPNTRNGPIPTKTIPQLSIELERFMNV